MTAFDLLGFKYFFAHKVEPSLHQAATNRSVFAVSVDMGFMVGPTTSLSASPKDRDVLFVRGGTKHMVSSIENAETL